MSIFLRLPNQYAAEMQIYKLMFYNKLYFNYERQGVV